MTATELGLASSLVDFIACMLYSLRFEFFFLGLAIFSYTFAFVKLPRKLASPTSKTRKGRRANAITAKEGADQATLRAIELQAAVEGVAHESRLKSVAWVLPRLAEVSNVDLALSALNAALDAGMNLREANVEEANEAVAGVCLALVRASSPAEAVQLLERVQSQGVPISRSLCSSMVRLCTSRQYFRETIACCDVHFQNSAPGDLEESVLSCGLFCCVELHDYSRCPELIKGLRGTSTRHVKDYANMVRYYAAVRECDEMFIVLEEMKERQLEADSFIYNTILHACVAMKNMKQARVLLESMHQIGDVADVITYNTLLKGYLKLGSMNECFQLLADMKERGIMPSQVTYGILLDGCINRGAVDRASVVFDMMLRSQCPMNTVLYTMLIKGLCRTGKVKEAMHVYNEMLKDSAVQPDLITFSLLIKAHCDAGQLEEAFALIDKMPSLGLRPDEVIFNTLLVGCTKVANGELAKRIYSDMVASGEKPSNSTFSILVRIFFLSKMLDEAVDMVRTEPEKVQVKLEARVYAQLVHSCLRARYGRQATEAYRLMLERVTPPRDVHSSILSVCSNKLNMLYTAADLLGVAAEKKARIDPNDAQDVLRIARRKQNHELLERLEGYLRDLKIPVPA